MKRRIRDLLKKKPDITQNNRLLQHLFIEIGAGRGLYNKEGFETLETVLRELAREKIITIDYNSSQAVGIHLKQSLRTSKK